MRSLGNLVGLLAAGGLSIGLLAAAACGGTTATIPGTEVPESPQNKEIIGFIEGYRSAVERQDAPALMVMASLDYWEDGGTPSGADDYGFDGLKGVLATRFTQAEQVRYSIRYLRIRRHDALAYVEALVHASWTIKNAHGKLVRRDKKSQEQFVVRQEEGRWRFVSGM